MRTKPLMRTMRTLWSATIIISALLLALASIAVLCVLAAPALALEALIDGPAEDDTRSANRSAPTTARG